MHIFRLEICGNRCKPVLLNSYINSADSGGPGGGRRCPIRGAGQLLPAAPLLSVPQRKYSDQLQSLGLGHSLSAAAHAQLLEQPAAVGLQRVVGDVEQLPDLRAALAPAH